MACSNKSLRFQSFDRLTRLKFTQMKEFNLPWRFPFQQWVAPLPTTFLFLSTCFFTSAEVHQCLIRYLKWRKKPFSFLSLAAILIHNRRNVPELVHRLNQSDITKKKSMTDSLYDMIKCVGKSTTQHDSTFLAMVIAGPAAAMLSPSFSRDKFTSLGMQTVLNCLQVFYSLHLYLLAVIPRGTEVLPCLTPGR